jgi:predicted metal-binding membrane protein
VAGVELSGEKGLGRRRLDPAWVAIALVAVAFVTWLVTLDRMEGMDAGPGTDPGALGWFVGVWVTMMAAMMLPSALPMVLLFARVSRGRAGRGWARPVPVAAFVGGYLATWTVYGLVAYGIYHAVDAVAGNALAWDRAGPYVAGIAVAVAGLYQLTPIKDVCLRHCRTPLHFLVHDWRDGIPGAARMGAEHGLYCIGCCWGLMLALFAIGVMSIFWMALVAAVIFVEKVVPLGRYISYAVAAALMGLGIWIAAAPDSVPRLTDPANAPAMMDMGSGEGSMGGSMTEEGGAQTVEPSTTIGGESTVSPMTEEGGARTTGSMTTTGGDSMNDGKESMP